MRRSLPFRSALSAIALAAIVAACASAAEAPSHRPAPEVASAAATAYEMLVTNESADLVSRVRFTPGEGFETVREIPVGVMPMEPDAPHGVVASADGEHYYVSLAHGTPYGYVWKYDARADTLIDRVMLGRFPASMDLTPNGEYLFVTNFNLHGDHVPSDVSVVHTATMQEVARPVTCVMPHGNRVNDAGTRLYNTCMHSDQLVELSTETFEVTARFGLAPGREGALALDDLGEMAGHDTHAEHDSDRHDPAEVGHAHEGEPCRPTWATPGRGEREAMVYVPCNGRAEVVEVDSERWELTRRFATGHQPYNSEVTPDGRLLIVTLRGDQGVQIFDLERGEEVRRLETTQPITHGVVASPDGRYAFVTSEAIGSTPGTLGAIDLETLEWAGDTELRYQPTGIDLLPQ